MVEGEIYFLRGFRFIMSRGQNILEPSPINVISISTSRLRSRFKCQIREIVTEVICKNECSVGFWAIRYFWKQPRL